MKNRRYTAMIYNAIQNNGKNMLLLLVGIPGSGKSTVARQFADMGCAVINNDDIRRELTGSVNDLSRDMVVFDIAYQRIFDALENGRHCIFDAMNVDTKYRREFVKRVRERFGYNIILSAVLVPCDTFTAKQRIEDDLENCVDRSNVPEDVIYRMQDKYTYTEAVIKDEDFDFVTIHNKNKPRLYE